MIEDKTFGNSKACVSLARMMNGVYEPDIDHKNTKKICKILDKFMKNIKLLEIKPGRYSQIMNKRGQIIFGKFLLDKYEKQVDELNECKYVKDVIKNILQTRYKSLVEKGQVLC